MNWMDRKRIANETYKPSDYSVALDVRRLRMDIFKDNRVPLEASGSHRLEVFNTRKESMGLQTIFVCPSKSVGARKTRGGRGHRLFILCPACGLDAEVKIPVGRLHQHYGYKHPKA